MFHVKHRRSPLLVAFAAVSLLAAGCVGGNFASPNGWAAPVEAGDVLLVQSERGRIDALELTAFGTVLERWHYPVSDDGVDLNAIYATPIVDGGTVYIAGFSGHVVALSLATGRPLPGWGAPVRIDGHIVATPAFDGERLYVPTDRGRVTAVDAANGSVGDVLLDVGGNASIWGDPVLVGGTLYVGDLDRTLHAIRVGSGEERWVQRLDGALAAPLELDRELLLAGALDSRLYALDADAEGALSWSFQGDNWFWSRPLVAGDVIYAPTAEGTVYAIDRSSGEERWHLESDTSQIRTSLALAEGVLVAAAKNGDLFGISPSNGALLWQSSLSDDVLADPLVRGSELIYITTDGDLMRVHPQDGRVERISRVSIAPQGG
jgi:outer membrane protein assembly factor BamB